MTAAETRDLLARLMRTIAPEVDLETVDAAAPLQVEAELDSMDSLDLMTALYDETGIEVPRARLFPGRDHRGIRRLRGGERRR